MLRNTKALLVVHFVFLCFFALSGHDFSVVQGQSRLQVESECQRLRWFEGIGGSEIKCFLVSRVCLSSLRPANLSSVQFVPRPGMGH